MQHKTITQRDVNRPEYLRAKKLAHFLDKVQITKHCWIWIGGLDGKGYGHFWTGEKTVLAHRFSYEFFVGPIESGKCILHRRECDSRSCVNPNHLYMGTHADNVRDMMLWGNRNFLKGENHPNAKLSKEDVLEIRRIHKDKKNGYKATAKIFNVNVACISKIVRRVRWKHI